MRRKEQKNSHFKDRKITKDPPKGEASPPAPRLRASTELSRTSSLKSGETDRQTRHKYVEERISIGGQARHRSERITIGGQAVLEGVMMRGKRNWVVAVRKPDGEITVEERELKSLAERIPFLKWFVLRGVVTLVETLSLALKALSISAQEATDEDVEISGKEMAVTIIVALLLVVGLFVIFPAYLVRATDKLVTNVVWLNLLEGLLRVSIFIVYLLIISRLKDIARVFEYHGAEHKVIHAFEKGEELTPKNASKYSTLHVACGTSFLVVVLILSIFVFSFLGKPSILYWILTRLLVIPVIAGVSYEVIKLARRYQDFWLVKVVMRPGLWVEKLTTREPSNDQLEVAITSLRELLTLEGIETKEQVEECMP